MRRRTLFNRANHLLAVLNVEIQQSTSVGLTDLNVHAETFYRDLLNEVYGHGLENMNLYAKNFPAIDLASDANRICFQVTSQEGAKKVRDTILAFEAHGLAARFDRLVIVVLSGRATGRKAKYPPTALSFDPAKDIWDTRTLAKAFEGLQPKELESLVRLLEENIQETSEASLPRELRTLVTMLEFLSSAAVTDVQEFLSEPDPEGKVYKRFTEHSAYLLGRFTDLHPDYGELLQDVRKSQGLSGTDYRRMSNYLRGKSDRVLTARGGDPVLALEDMVAEFRALLAAAGVDYDIGAIEFFLIDELIRCNVFPNRRPAHA
ncbi:MULTISPECIES: SMEK domain-containing protein [Agrobacterium]|uniref:SMEK domain-containing protein n=1 Tax=Agrobacterium TaxID=357 RepID=UPI0027894591|nr:SMEK domain-containing protein [Agrobacterium sp. SORGH_AS_0745]MDP9762120.1 hypothetical protein [Agrobacterium tumefaciens]MDQ1220590.1 hypothetical protein [Agrobacterium sp. SORGH_AS_0745]